MRFNVYLMVIDVILFIYFIYDWYKMYKKTGWSLDYWNLSMTLMFFMPFLIQYPFSSSIFNAISVGSNVPMIQGSLDTCYLIFLAGYVSTYFGRYIFDKFKFKTTINFVFIQPFKQTLTKLFIICVKNSLTVRVLIVFYFVSLICILIYGAMVGAGFDIRAVFQANPEIRAFYNFVLILSSVVSLLLTARIFQYNRLIDKLLMFLFLIFTLFIGARAFLAQPIISLFGFYVFYSKRGRISLLKVGAIGISVMFLGISLSAIRAGEFSLRSFAVGFGEQIFFGNSYSDLRDFAWVYSYWDGTLLYGKTYLAAFMSFIPSFLSDFRTEWTAGKFTATTVGFDPLVHPGLRPGLFGEAFLNFGLIGVIFLGIIFGYALKYVDFNIRRSSLSKDKIGGIAATVSIMFIFNLPVTSGFFSLYVFIVVLILASLAVNALKRLSGI